MQKNDKTTYNFLTIVRFTLFMVYDKGIIHKASFHCCYGDMYMLSVRLSFYKMETFVLNDMSCSVIPT